MADRIRARRGSAALRRVSGAKSGAAVQHPRKRSRVESGLGKRAAAVAKATAPADPGRAILEPAAERLKRLIEAAGGFTYSISVSEGRVVSIGFGAGCESAVGYSSSALDAQPYLWNLLVLPEDRPKVERAYREMLILPRKQYLDYRARHSDGSVHWLSQVLVPLTDKNGRLVGYDGVVLDVTAGASRLACAESAEEDLRRLLDSSETLACSLDRSGRLQAANTAFRAAFARHAGGRQPITGERILAGDLPGAALAELRLCFERALAGESSRARVEADLGSGARQLECSFAPLPTEGSGTRGVAVFVSDRSPEARERLVLASVSRAIAPESGIACLDRIAEALESWLGAEGVVLGEFLEDGRGLRVWAARYRGSRLEGAPFSAEGGSCRSISGQACCLRPKHGPWVLPREAGPPSLSLDCHLGVPILGQRGDTIGMLCVISRKPILMTGFRAEVMGIMAARASPELLRLRSS